MSHDLADIFAAIAHREMPDRGWAALTWLLSVLAGVVVLASPGLSLYGLAVILGVWLLILGGMEIGAASRLRALTRR